MLSDFLDRRSIIPEIIPHVTNLLISRPMDAVYLIFLFSFSGLLRFVLRFATFQTFQKSERAQGVLQSPSGTDIMQSAN